MLPQSYPRDQTQHPLSRDRLVNGFVQWIAGECELLRNGEVVMPLCGDYSHIGSRSAPCRRQLFCIAAKLFRLLIANRNDERPE